MEVGGGDAQEAAEVCAADPLDSGFADALFVEGSVDEGHNVVVAIELGLFVLD